MTSTTMKNMLKSNESGAAVRTAAFVVSCEGMMTNSDVRRQ